MSTATSESFHPGVGPATDPFLAYQSRRAAGSEWRAFLLALLETLDANMDGGGRDALLRTVGARLGGSTPLRPAATLSELEGRMNEVLAGLGWGYLALHLDEADRSLRLVLRAAPCLPVAADVAGAWLGTVLEGVFGAWLAAQQGGDAAARVSLLQTVPGLMVFRYGS
ncbi:cellulose biosynthesis protein BcsD [Pseudoroseomonas globiformis]|uniref:Cellulose biosynthesis protein BcsD n=1 Tax=Teichococcus globiformis TaxID=2307229 RepID=A0ABV7G2J4_9PROT